MSIFNKIQLKRPKNSAFNLSHDNKLTLEMGKLVPTLCMDVLPGDKFKMGTEAMLRMMPMIAPIMHKVDIYTHYFFVPNRILWKGWEEFISGQVSGPSPKPPVPAAPFIGSGSHAFNDVQRSTLADYLGIPFGFVADDAELRVNALPFAAYQRIWYDYFRDENLQDDELEPSLTNGKQDPSYVDYTLSTLRTRAWEHDYFTSALPFAQKGDAVNIPLSPTGSIDIVNNNTNTPWLVKDTDGYVIPGGDLGADAGGQLTSTLGNKAAHLDPMDTLSGDVDSLELQGTINDLRTAFSLQKWLEKNARAGTRYVELLMAHFGIRSQDSRLQRAEYIGGGKSTMAISEVLQTSETVGSPQGNMAGHGISVQGSNPVSYKVPEHGYIIALMSIRPKTAYFQGLPRHFSRLDRLDYYWPDFAFLGEQEVKNKEVYAIGTTGSSNDETFGYLPRYSEYRYIPSSIHGEMVGTLKYWHMGREFGVRPALSAEFIECNPTKRIFAAVDSTDEIVAHVYHNILAIRPMPKYGSPGSI